MNIRLFLLSGILLLFIIGAVTPPDIAQLKNYVANKDYEMCIQTGNDMLALVSGEEKLAVYYYLGMAYSEQGMYDEARAAFQEILARTLKGAYSERAHLGFARTFSREENISKAVNAYRSFMTRYPHSVYLPQCYLEGARVLMRYHEWKEARYYLRCILGFYPDTPEARAASKLLANDESYSLIQVGAFGKEENAKKCVSALKTQGFDAFITRFTRDNQVYYRVQAGYFTARHELFAAKEKLEKLGYKVHILN